MNIDLNDSSVSYKNQNTSDILVQNKKEINDKKNEEIQLHDKNSQLISSDISNNKVKNNVVQNNNNINNNNNNINNEEVLRTSSSPTLNKYKSKNTITSIATKLPPNNNYHNNIISPESFSESHLPNSNTEKKASQPIKSRISTGTRTTTTIVTQPSNVDNSNVVLVPFSPTSNGYSESSMDSSSPHTPSSSFASYNKAAVSPSLTNTTVLSTSIDRSKLSHEVSSYIYIFIYFIFFVLFIININLFILNNLIKDSYTSKKKIFSIKGNQTQCVIPELVPQSPDQKSVAPECKIIKLLIKYNY